MSPDTRHGDARSSRYEYDQDVVPPSMAVVAALSDVRDLDPVDQPPLYETIDVDALDTFLQGRAETEGNIAVTISVGEFAVRVRSDGAVTVSPADEDRTNGHREGGQH